MWSGEIKEKSGQEGGCPGIKENSEQEGGCLGIKEKSEQEGGCRGIKEKSGQEGGCREISWNARGKVLIPKCLFQWKHLDLVKCW